MFNLYKKIYKTIEQSTDNNFRLFAQNKKVIIKKISVSDYFHLIEIIFNNETHFIIRVWKNNLAETIKYKNNKFSKYENIYNLSDGYEISNENLKNKINQKLLSFLNEFLDPSL